MRKRSAAAHAGRRAVVALAVLAVSSLSCAMRHSAESGTERGLSSDARADTGRAIARGSFEFDPSGARRGFRYAGTVLCRSEGACPNLVEASSIEARAARTSGLADLRVFAFDPAAASFSCSVLVDAAPTEKVHFAIETPRVRFAGDGYLCVVDAAWDPSWLPRAVAPADTTVPDSTAVIILDSTRSTHPAGFEAMHFQWWIDGGSEVIKGGPITSTNLPRGRHTIILRAQDRFGNVSVDTMVVNVE